MSRQQYSRSAERSPDSVMSVLLDRLGRDWRQCALLHGPYRHRPVQERFRVTTEKELIMTLPVKWVTRKEMLMIDPRHKEHMNRMLQQQMRSVRDWGWLFLTTWSGFDLLCHRGADDHDVQPFTSPTP